MNLFQARPGEEVEVLVTTRASGFGVPMTLWIQAVVHSRNFYREEVCVEFPGPYSGERMTIACEGRFELPRLRPIGDGQ